MTFVSTGAAVPTRVTFNTGTLNFGNSQIVNIDNITLDIEWSLSPLFVLGSIKPQDLVRHTQKVALTGKLISFPAEMAAMALGSSTIGTPTEIDTLDGQPTFQSPVATFTDRNGKEIQYQLTGAIWKKFSLSAKNEAYGEWDFELEAKDITALDYTV
jgi:hypothetical protein